MDDGAEGGKAAVWHMMGKRFHKQVWWSEVVPNFSVLIIFYVEGYLQGTYINEVIVSG